MEVFYLKFNQNERVLHQCANIWLEIISEMENPYVCFIVDKDNIIERLKAEVNFRGVPHEFIKSQRDSNELQSVVRVLSPMWHNAGYAHLTTFWHAREHGYKNFWNLDGDDMVLYATPHKVAQMFYAIKDYAEKNQLDAFGLDTWNTVNPPMSEGWTYGISYISNRINWIDLMMDSVDGFSKIHKQPDPRWNIDVFTNYLSMIEKVINTKMFYCENLYAVLNSVASPYLQPCFGSLRYWHKGYLYFPVVINDFKMGEAGVLQIPEALVKIDVGITPEECVKRMKDLASTSFMWKAFITPPPYTLPRSQIFLRILAAIFYENMVKKKTTLSWKEKPELLLSDRKKYFGISKGR